MTRVVMFLIGLTVVLAVQANPIPEDGQEKRKDTAVLHPYTETNDTYSTIDEILAEIRGRKGDLTFKEEKKHVINKRALGCASTSVAYGSTTGTAFADFIGTNPWPCGVDIHEIRIYSGSLIDAIQVTYKTFDGQYILKPRRGGPRGIESVVRLETGEKITGVAGMECRATNWGNNKYIIQLVFFSEKGDGQKAIYGPYGWGRDEYHPCKLFAVQGRINSIFGKVQLPHNNLIYLGAIGFYYEDESRAAQHTTK